MTTTTAPWQPQVLWLPMGGLLGALAGALTGMALLLVTSVAGAVGSGASNEGLGTSMLFILVAGPWFGGIAGLVVGLFVGAEMMFLVGAHLPRDVARRRAHRWGFVLPPLTMVALLVVPTAVDGSGDLELAMPGTEALWWLFALAGGSLLGGPFARWLAGFHPPLPQQESR